jgi:uncharacterized cofD-like protein
LTSDAVLTTLPGMTTHSVPKVVVIGGGTGTYVLLQALRGLPVHLTALLTMVDDGGSNRVMRDQFGLLPTSGICQAISALSDDETLLRELFNYRFHQGDGLSGLRFGNLFLAAVADIVGSQRQAIQDTLRLLKVKGDIFPISFDDVRLVAKYEDGTEVVGEHLIDEPDHDGRLHIVDLRTEPKASLGEEAAQAIAEADFIIMGPGDFYTNTVANFVVAGVPAALKASAAKKIFFSNLMTKYGETFDFTLENYLQELDKYYGLDGLDALVINNNLNFRPDILKLYAEDHSVPVLDDVTDNRLGETLVYRADLLSDEVPERAPGDVLARSMLRHDPEKIAAFFQSTFLKK